jgi:hypothetical protein
MVPITVYNLPYGTTDNSRTMDTAATAAAAVALVFTNSLWKPFYFIINDD